MRLKAAAVLLLSLAASGALLARWVQIDVRNVPVERVTQNLERELAAKPNDVTILVNLARVHAMAFAQKRDTVPSAVPMGMGEPKWEAAPHLGQGAPEYLQPHVRSTNDPTAQAAAREQLQKAIARYREALAIDPTHLVAKMGLGWTLSQTGDRAGAIEALRDVVAGAWPLDEKGDPARPYFGPFRGYRYLTEEAALYLVPLLDHARDRDEIAVLRKKAQTLEKRVRKITPIAIPLEDGLTAADIENHGRAVVFDADGSGVPKRWTWIRPNAGWLVFDRYNEGRITSGLQLFGNVTFWLFWGNGYDALRSLDDDGDGAIAGRELEGLALWHDRNSNGVSDRGEVRPVRAWGVVSLSAAYEHDAGHPDEIAFSPKGVTFQSGAVRPTFDFILQTSGPSKPEGPYDSGVITSGAGSSATRCSNWRLNSASGRLTVVASFASVCGSSKSSRRNRIM
jgi:tetratricopeptide (TPR) repeat protein